jgi:CHAD domain-containing protein
MQGLIDEVPQHLLRIQVRLFACRERLLADTDAEALHDLRIAVRQLRSLLRPLSTIEACAELQLRAAELGRLTGPLRDLEVLQIYLREHGFKIAAQARQPLLQQGYAALLSSAPLAQLMSALDEWPQQWREAASSGQLRGLRRLIKQRLRKDRKHLVHALDDPAHDRHRLRLLVKRLRYAAEAYPSVTELPARTRKLLKLAQSTLPSQPWAIGMTIGSGWCGPMSKRICSLVCRSGARPSSTLSNRLIWRYWHWLQALPVLRANLAEKTP